MVFNGDFRCDGCKPGTERIAKRLAESVRNFNGSCAEDAWLLAAQGGFVLHGFLNPPNEITAGLDILPAL